jgi:membrane-associated phospholipid phosphatase
LRFTWPLLTFFAANIICATMFLRWHYVIDVFAGFALATLAALVAPRVTHWEVARRRLHGLQPLVPLFGSGDTAGSAPDGVGRAAA